MTPSLRDLRLPVCQRGLRIGLLGGSFNPPHAAHRAISLFAMKRLGLDRVWWLVTPGNPLKDPHVVPPLAERIAAARACARHPRIDVTGLEAAIGTRYTVDTVTWLLRHCASVRFVWLMGADNLASFHRWRQWREIAARLPFAVVDRGGTGPDVLASRAALALARWRLPESAAPSLPGRRPPAWVFLRGVRLPISSTALRARLSQKGRGGAKSERREVESVN
ncbi:MAG: nicotinate-nucleotide adenylyltransferase [Xanthobacteraceae bacterium]|nr:nicotinate-nucleotide adenylyltransferase [Xanthobacteraceae bacterium]PWB66744.1 MAG: nicotinic acid mononucleotide adenylyltransferase [Bradyrhizobiaceae bacterium]